MPILYVNPGRKGKKKGLKVRGSARVARRAKARRSHGAKKRRGKMPAALAAYWKKKRSKGRKATIKKRRRKARRSKIKEKTKMARRRKRSKRKSSHRRKRRSHKRRSHRRKARRSRKHRKHRRTRRKARRSRKRRSHRRRKARRSRRKSSRRRRRRARRSKGRSRTRKIRRRRRRSSTIVMPYTGKGRTMKGYAHNPRRRRRKSRRRARRSSRRLHRRYRRSSYRKNPGGMLIDLAKKAVPVLIGVYGARFLVQKIGPMVPFVSSLPASIQGPALAVGTVLLTNYATKKVSALAKHREPLMLGVGIAAVEAFISAFAPASIKSMIGVGDVYDRSLADYVAVGDYVEMGATPIDDNITMSDYIAVGGVEEELGMGVDEELGIDEELGNDLLGGVSSSSMLKTVPTRNFLAPVPARSFTQPVPPATAAYDNAAGIYQGIFRGGF